MMHVSHPAPAERKEFLVDGCPRCAQYADDLGLHFDPERWCRFWWKMLEVEFDNTSGYESETDKRLGRKLFYVALGYQRATGIDPHTLVPRPPPPAPFLLGTMGRPL